MPKKTSKPRSPEGPAHPKNGASGLPDVSNVRVRMYRQGLGDCFLLSFGKDSSFTEAAHVLIDCGTLGATTTKVKIKDVVADIALTTKNKTTAKSELALLVATHEHQDHLSGFNSEREA